MYTDLCSRSPRLYPRRLWTPVLCRTWHSESSPYARTDGKEKERQKMPQTDQSVFILNSERMLWTEIFLTLPPPMTFSAAYTVLPHRGHASEPPAFWANLEALGLFVGRWGACLSRWVYFCYCVMIKVRDGVKGCIKLNINQLLNPVLSN